EFEIIFSARHTTDPALKVVDILRSKYPKIPSSVVLSGEPSYPNAKVFALEKMLACTSASYLVITDSDVCVTPDCLREVVSPLLDPRNGVVTCLYRGVAAGGSWSRLEALGMSVEIALGSSRGEHDRGHEIRIGANDGDAQGCAGVYWRNRSTRTILRR